ncbi:alpha-2B adrenergic receptor-like [Gigantopelta aegis]|uniref:alpha-2B adrenergic receptor-like n=1 Tax=Gigantopelta aegis TaxID=1735272 RepID=UPI001B887CEF|nr:alpha-2B adrenergic receptor-like [Gigantopelta aegis]
MLILWLPPCITDRLKNSRPNVCKWEPSENKEFVIVVASIGQHGSCLVLLFCYLQVFLFMRRRMKIGPLRAKSLANSSQTARATTFSQDRSQDSHEIETDTSRRKFLEKTDASSQTQHCAKNARKDILRNQTDASSQNPDRVNNSENAMQAILENETDTYAQNQDYANNPENTKQEVCIAGNNIFNQSQNHVNDPETNVVSTISQSQHGSRNFLSVPVYSPKTSTATGDEGLDSGEVAEKRERKVFVTLTYIIFGYMICWVPFHFVFDVSAIDPTLVPEIVYTITFWMTYLNSTVNPFLYNFSSPEFRKAFKKILHIN